MCFNHQIERTQKSHYLKDQSIPVVNSLHLSLHIGQGRRKYFNIEQKNSFKVFFQIKLTRLSPLFKRRLNRKSTSHCSHGHFIVTQSNTAKSSAKVNIKYEECDWLLVNISNQIQVVMSYLVSGVCTCMLWMIVVYSSHCT